MNQPLVVAYGMGVDSTAMLFGLSGIGIRPMANLPMMRDKVFCGQPK